VQVAKSIWHNVAATMGDAKTKAPSRLPGTPLLTARRPRWAFWGMVALTLVVCAIRFTDLSARTYWVDEGFTLYRVYGTWSDIVTNAINLQGLSTSDIHPPLYFAALKLWVTFGGANEYVMRAFSVFCGILLVPLSYVAGRRLFGRGAGVIAGVLAALSPAYQWYSWEIRMYSLTPLLAALTMYLLARAIGAKHFRPLAFAGWAAMSLVAVFTHYSSVSLLIAQAAFVFVSLFLRVRRFRGRYLAALALIGVASMAAAFFLPGISNSARQILSLLLLNASQPRPEPVSLIAIIHDVLGASTFGMNAADPTGGLLEAAVAAVVVAGVFLPLSRVRLSERALTAASIVTPVLFWSALSHVLENRPSFRYVIIILPAMHALMGHFGAMVWSRFVRSQQALGGWRNAARAGIGIAVIAFILGVNAFGLERTFVRTSSWQDDWPSLIRYVRQHWQPGDALMINLYTPETVMQDFLGDMPMDILIARKWVASAPESVLAQRLQSQYTRIWHVNTGGDGGYMSAEVREIFRPFDRRDRVTFPSRTNILQLDRYDTRAYVGDAIPPDARQLAVPPAPPATYPVAYKLRPGSEFGQTPSAALTLYWARGQAVELPASLSIRLRDKNDDVWMDWNIPAELEDLPRACSAGKVCAADYTLLLPPGLPLITYRLDLAPLSSAGRPSSPQVTVPLEASDVSCCLRTQRALAAKVTFAAGDVALADAEFPDRLHPGDPLALVLTWRPIRTAAPGWATRISLAPLIGNDVATVVREAGPPDLPPSAWPVGELIRDQYALPLPYTIVPGVYRLMLARTGPGAPMGDSFLGFVQVEDFPRSPVPASVPVSISARVGEMTLLGYGFDAPFARGDTTELRTMWRADGTPSRDGVLFVHVLSPQGKLVAQDDNSPEQGKRATQTFRAGDGINQLQRLALPADLPAGEYRVMSGIYDRAGGARWPATRDGQPARDDLVPLMTFTLPELPPMFRAFLPVVSTGGAAQ